MLLPHAATRLLMTPITSAMMLHAATPFRATIADAERQRLLFTRQITPCLLMLRRAMPRDAC